MKVIPSNIAACALIEAARTCAGADAYARVGHAPCYMPLSRPHTLLHPPSRPVRPHTPHIVRRARVAGPCVRAWWRVRIAGCVVTTWTEAWVGRAEACLRTPPNPATVRIEGQLVHAAAHISVPSSRTPCARPRTLLRAPLSSVLTMRWPWRRAGGHGLGGRAGVRMRRRGYPQAGRRAAAWTRNTYLR